MSSVLIQAGHAPDAGGAPGEARWTARLAERIAARLRAAGVDVTIVGDWFNRQPPAEALRDYELFVSLHYDAAIYAARGDPRGNTGCFADRAAADPVGELSDRAIQAWEAVYPAGTGILLTRDRSNANTRQYYAFRSTTARTPGIIIEHGCGAPVGTGGFPPGDDAAFLHGQIDGVADLDTRAILAFVQRGSVQEIVLEDDDMAKLSEEDRAILDVVNGLGANAASVVGWINEIGALKAANEQLRQQLTDLAVASGRRVARVSMVYDDGSTQQLPAA
ncbi:MAG: hypothetical protein ACRDI2_07010 [Chloroflexota bacterium]